MVDFSAYLLSFRDQTHCKIYSSIQADTNPVHGEELAQKRFLSNDRNRRKPEKIDRRENTVDDQIQVESPAPGR